MAHFNLSNHGVLAEFCKQSPKRNVVRNDLSADTKRHLGITNSKTVKVTVDLYGDELAHIDAAIWLARKAHYAMTLNWVENGKQLLPAKLYMKYTEELRQHRATIQRLVDALDYDAIIERRKVALNGAYRETDYPGGAHSLKESFSVSIAITPVPESSQFNTIADMIDIETTMLIAEHEKRITDATQLAMKDVWDRLYEVIQHVAQKYKLGNAAAVNESDLGNIQSLIDILPALNITNDPGLEDMRRKIEKEILSFSSNSLKKDEVRQKELAAKADAIISAMTGFMGAL